ncbi:beta-ketoacyl-[acyl-carrier-protein] synthase family protein [Streptomyces sp. NPDC058457]|uniref:beta-ketoacyl-[acyl-carrier-protein] synthase family protein n=1 Tax=Streptomyces sp. NPDC058457 TaxID=3346507 RepID=UPI0036644804
MSGAAVTGLRRPEMVITGIGMVTPAGVDTATTWKTVCAGEPAASADPRLTNLTIDFGCAVTGFDPELILGVEARRMDAFTRFAVASAHAAVADAELTDGCWDPARVGVVLGTGIGGQPTWEEQGRRLRDRGPRTVNPLTVPRATSNIAAGTVAMELGLHGPSLSVATACATGTTALGYALDLLRAGRCDVLLAGGTEATVPPLAVTAFDRLKAPSHPYARLMGYGATSDAHHLTSPAPDGHWAELAVRQALADAGVQASDVTLVNAHATSTPQGDDIEARMIERVFGRGAAVVSTKGVTGHLLGAAGAVETGLTALSIAHGVVPPTADFGSTGPDAADIDIVHGAARQVPVPPAVSNSFGFGGQNAVVVPGSVRPVWWASAAQEPLRPTGSVS